MCDMFELSISVLNYTYTYICCMHMHGLMRIFFFFWFQPASVYKLACSIVFNTSTLAVALTVSLLFTLWRWFGRC